MKKSSLILLAFIIAISAGAQTTPVNTNDTLYAVRLKEVDVKARWKNDTERYHYNQMKFYVKSILPYLDAATKLFNEVNGKIQQEGIPKKERRQFINSREEEMRDKFEDKIKELNVTQGVLLVKLIARQTDLNIYKILQEFKNPLTAMKWQGWARLHGINLNKKYHPEDEGYLELIMEDLGYPLPASYALNND